MPDLKRIINVIPLTRVSLRNAQIFTYLVPLKLQGQLRPGQLVVIPFGRRRIMGATSSVENHRLNTETRGLKELFDLAYPEPVLTEQNLSLADWLADYYVCSLGQAVKVMLPKFVKTPRDPGLVGYERYNPDFILTEHQRKAVNAINTVLDQPAQVLLHGITGSGKTEVYLQIMKRVIESGKQVIMLVPEISLTPQAIQRLAKRFGIETVAVLHSGLKDSERLWMWQKIRSSEAKIVIGPRSALFAPVQDLGLLVIDDEHDPSFKQYDQAPKYQSRKVAEKLSQLWSCPLILGDATPSVETYYQMAVPAPEENRHLLVLPHRIKADLGLPTVRVVDMRRERAAGNESILSELLKFELANTLARKKQALLYLNRRGTATFVMCRDCGVVQICSQCDVPLVHHAFAGKLICHQCGRKTPVPERCPQCHGERIDFFGSGTQRVEEEIKKFVAKESRQAKQEVVVGRLDRDNAAVESNRVYQDWQDGKINVLVGTQLVAKGWDIPGVALVGVVSADTTLYLPDFRSNERTFQLLTQVAGRTGRDREQGKVVLQTYHPDNFAIQAAKTHDYEKFYREEIANRRKYLYPPFARLVKLSVRGATPAKAEEQSRRTATYISVHASSNIQVLGPAPAYYAKRRGSYHWQIVLKIKSGAKIDLYRILRELPAEIDIDVDPDSLL